jgi:hypothetical protein
MSSNPHTIFVVSVFSFLYLLYSIHETSRLRRDIYDLVMLSAVAVVPLFFVLWPQSALELTRLAGIEFPFVLMFGVLFVFLFVFIHRMTTKLHALDRDVRVLVQEVSLLRSAARPDSAGNEHGGTSSDRVETAGHGR